MDRPASRSQAGGTAQRGTLGSRAGLGTASRPGSASRRGIGVAVSTNVSVADRPVTQQGLGGVRLGTQGPGRMVADKNYWIGILRQKTQEIKKEIERIHQSIENLQKESGQSHQLERRYEDLVKEIRELQGDLADHNLVVDKVGSQTEPQEIAYYYSALRNKNQQEKQNVDKVFKERQRKERELFDVEQQIVQCQNANEAKMNDLSPEDKQQYLELQEENSKLQATITAQQESLDELGMHIRHHEEELQGDPARMKMAELLDQKKRLLQRKDDLAMSAQGPEAREQLLAKVKGDNVEIARLDEEITRAKEDMEAKKKKLDSLAQELRNGPASDENAQKYEKLLTKEKEMKEFIENFEESKQKELANIAETEQTIVALLEHISHGLESSENAPTKERYEEMKKDLEFKERQMSDAKGTFSNLQQEKELREMELEKIKTLDKKINVELDALTNRIQSMKEELVVYGDLEKLQADFDRQKQELLSKKQVMSRMADTMTQQVQLLNTRLESRKRDLQKSDTFNDLEKLEMKMKHHEQNIFALNEFIEMKSRESNYEEFLEHVKTTVGEINEILKTQQRKL